MHTYQASSVWVEVLPASKRRICRRLTLHIPPSIQEPCNRLIVVASSAILAITRRDRLVHAIRRKTAPAAKIFARPLRYPRESFELVRRFQDFNATPLLVFDDPDQPNS